MNTSVKPELANGSMSPAKDILFLLSNTKEQAGQSAAVPMMGHSSTLLTIEHINNISIF